MNVFDILKNLYTNPSSKWIIELDDSCIQPVVIQRFLSLNNITVRQARVLNKFVFYTSPKVYLSAAWSLLFFDGKKLNKTPFIKYPKKDDKQDRYFFLYEKIQKHFNLSDTQINLMKQTLLKEIDKDKVNWFSFYGIDKQYWTRNYMNIDQLRTCQSPLPEGRGLSREV